MSSLKKQDNTGSKNDALKIKVVFSSMKMKYFIMTMFNGLHHLHLRLIIPVLLTGLDQCLSVE